MIIVVRWDLKRAFLEASMPVDDPGWNTNLSAVQEIDPHPMTGGRGERPRRL